MEMIKGQVVRVGQGFAYVKPDVDPRAPERAPLPTEEALSFTFDKLIDATTGKPVYHGQSPSKLGIGVGRQVTVELDAMGTVTAVQVELDAMGTVTAASF